jgi:pSer/pThr/pTyr-binding forkhead associated (FHA) protein
VPQLVITRGRDAGLEQAVSTHCVIGRAPESDVVAQDPGISRRHARIALEGEVYVIHDLGSRNGTIVNGRRVRAATLGDGDVVHLGRVELVFRLREIVAGAAPARATAGKPPSAQRAASRGTRPAEAAAGAEPPTTSGSSVVPVRRRRWVS